jgi:hypothetical protein
LNEIQILSETIPDVKRNLFLRKFSDSTGLGVSHWNHQIIGNHQVGDLSLKGRVGDSRLAPVDGW